MNRDDIIRMAKSVGIDDESWQTVQALRGFADLVAAAEREACASICDAEAKEWVEMRGWLDDFANALAKAIRARGQG